MEKVILKPGDSVIHPSLGEGTVTVADEEFCTVKFESREAMFFYGHPQNRFWKLMARLFDEEVPVTVEEKSSLILRNHLALWDSIRSCTITGSSDSSVKDVVPNDLSVIFDNSRVSRVFCNGALSHKMYMKYIFPHTNISAVKLPSTSPANAAFSVDRLYEHWKIILDR